MADLSKKIKMQQEQLKEAKALRKKINRDIKNGSKEVKGFFRRRKYVKHRANDYDEIYRLYGRKVYNKSIPGKIKEQSLKNALKEERYMDVLDIHGEDAFNEHLPQIMKHDIDYEAATTGQRVSGWLKKILPLKFKKVMKTKVLPIGMATLLAPAAILGATSYNRRDRENSDHQVEITEYLEDVQKYGEEVRQYNLNPLQAMMKVTSDMWKRIDGYGEPEIDLLEYAGMDVSKSMGVGVCRNMADDCARRLNAINSEWNARVIPVFCGQGDYERANIPFSKVENKEESISDDEVVSEDLDSQPKKSEEETYGVTINGKTIISISQEDVDQFIDEYVVDKVGNHAVVLIDVPEDNVTLVYDPTNAGVGLYYNGQIMMFNSYGTAHPIEIKTTMYGDFVYGFGKAIIDKSNNILSSFGIYTESRIKELNDKYGIKAQNEAIEYNKKIEKSQYQEQLRVNGADINKGDGISSFVVNENDINHNENIEDNDIEK